MLSEIQSLYLGIVILIVVSLGVTLFILKNSYLYELSGDKRKNLLPILFLASFAIYGLFFSIDSLFKAEPKNIESIGYDIFQVDIGLALIILGCGLAIFFASNETIFKQDDISKILICVSGILAIIGLIIILSTGIVYHKLL